MFKSLARHAVVVALVSSSLVVAPASAARATTSVDESPVSVHRTTCPPPSEGVTLDFWYADPPRHLITVNLCYTIPDDDVGVVMSPCPYPFTGYVVDVYGDPGGPHTFQLCFV